MSFERVLITGGSGFVGSSLAVSFRQSLCERVYAVDSLKRRGSELNLARLHAAGVKFLHADVRCPEDLEGLPEFDLLIDCSAEPSVHAGLTGQARYVLNTNLAGAINCLEAARVRRAAFLFLSTSRVYPIASLNALPYVERDTRFAWQADDAAARGFSPRGIAEDFRLDGARSLYGASKLAGELLIQEYVHSFGMKALVNRCGLLAGPWQLGKVDQGVVTLWVARHHFGQPLSYTGYGGTGKQVRDVLHVEDLFDLIERQCQRLDCWDGRVYNIGGGVDNSVSLRELTELCRDVTGRRIDITPVAETHNVDLRIYVTDSTRAEREFGWRARRGVGKVVADIHPWLVEREQELRRVFLE